MTSASGQQTLSGEQATTGGWDAIRADGAIQYNPVEMPEMNSEPPGWLSDSLEWLSDFLSPVGKFLAAIFGPLGELLGLSWPVMQWVLLAVVIAVLGWLLYRLLSPVLQRKGETYEAKTYEWVPGREEALALLEDADRLAAEGRYDEATHLLLKRSVHQIATARPEWVEPSSTARELAALPALPDAARSAFAAIAERVERSLFALRRLGLEDWQVAREAYATFALQNLPEAA